MVFFLKTGSEVVQIPCLSVTLCLTILRAGNGDLPVPDSTGTGRVSQMRVMSPAHLSLLHLNCMEFSRMISSLLNQVMKFSSIPPLYPQALPTPQAEVADNAKYAQ